MGKHTLVVQCIYSDQAEGVQQILLRSFQLYLARMLEEKSLVL